MSFLRNKTLRILLHPTIQKLSLIFLGILLAFILVESLLRISGGVYSYSSGIKTFRVPPKNSAYRIVCLGESTTAFGGKTSYPYQLERILNNLQTDVIFEVFNKGVPGTDTARIVAGFDEVVRTYNPDMVVVMMGINDNEHTPYFKSAAVNIELFWKSMRTVKLFKYIHNSFRNKFTGDVDENINRTVNYSLSKLEEIELAKLRKSPRDIEAIHALGEVYTFQKRYKKAEEMYKRSLKVASDVDSKVDSYISLGELYETQRKYLLAEQMYKKALELDPLGPWVNVCLGKLYAVLNKDTQAEAIFRKVIKIKPDEKIAYEMLAQLYFKNNNFDAAKKAYQLADKFNKTDFLETTKYNYRALKEKALAKNIKFIAVQYPLYNINALKSMFNSPKEMYFVDNEKVFREALQRRHYNDYFFDRFAEVFGHATWEGNRILAENIAQTIANVYAD